MFALEGCCLKAGPKILSGFAQFSLYLMRSTSMNRRLSLSYPAKQRQPVSAHFRRVLLLETAAFEMNRRFPKQVVTHSTGGALNAPVCSARTRFLQNQGTILSVWSARGGVGRNTLCPRDPTTRLRKILKIDCKICSWGQFTGWS